MARPMGQSAAEMQPASFWGGFGMLAATFILGSAVSFRSPTDAPSDLATLPLDLRDAPRSVLSAAAGPISALQAFPRLPTIEPQDQPLLIRRESFPAGPLAEPRAQKVSEWPERDVFEQLFGGDGALATAPLAQPSGGDMSPRAPSASGVAADFGLSLETRRRPNDGRLAWSQTSSLPAGRRPGTSPRSVASVAPPRLNAAIRGSQLGGRKASPTQGEPQMANPLQYTTTDDVFPSAIGGEGGSPYLSGMMVSAPTLAPVSGGAGGSRGAEQRSSGGGVSATKTSTPDEEEEDEEKARARSTPVKVVKITEKRTTAKTENLSLLGNTQDWTRDQGQPIRGWPTSDRLSSCGLIAAEALERFLKRRPELDRIDAVKALALAHRWWDSTVGMHGIDAERALIQSLGISTVKVTFSLSANSDFSELQDRLVAALASGRPVILSTPRHYYVAQGYANGRFFVGHTGEIMRYFSAAAGPWMTLQEIARAGLGIKGVLLPEATRIP